jgi:D-glycero-alpha-D-manno-heptose 1-phosphate guanylyltransferase
MEAIVLAGGLGTRLRSTVPDLPKVMAPVCGRPFLEILLSSLAAKGCQRAILSLGYLARQIQDHFGPRYAGIALEYVVEHAPLGTGGALRQAINRCEADHALVVNGDSYLDLDVDGLESHWHEHRHPIIVAREVEDTGRYGRLLARDGRLVGFTERGTPGRGLINAGYYLLPRDIVQHFPAAETFSLERDFLETAVDRCPFDVYITRGQFIDIGVPDDYQRAQSELLPLCQ